MGERLTRDVSQASGPALLSEEQAAFCAGRILSNYGLGLVRAKWEGITPLALKAELARQLGGVSWPAIVAGLDAMPGRHPDYPPNVGQLQALCKGCEPTKFYAALPAPNLTPAQIAERQAAAEEVNRIFAENCYQIPNSWTLWGTPHKPEVKGLGQWVFPDGTPSRDGAGFSGQFWVHTLWIGA